MITFIEKNIVKFSLFCIFQMKVKRQSKVKKILNFYKHNFGHHPPYQLLIDGTFTQACLKVRL